METLNQREKKDAVPAPFGTLFLPFLKVSEVPNRHQRPFLSGVNMEKGFTSQSDGLVPTTKYRFATCFGMAQQPSTDGHLGIPRNSY